MSKATKKQIQLAKKLYYETYRRNNQQRIQKHREDFWQRKAMELKPDDTTKKDGDL